jgi:hypothetical protein
MANSLEELRIQRATEYDSRSIGWWNGMPERVRKDVNSARDVYQTSGLKKLVEDLIRIEEQRGIKQEEVPFYFNGQGGISIDLSFGEKEEIWPSIFSKRHEQWKGMSIDIFPDGGIHVHGKRKEITVLKKEDWEALPNRLEEALLKAYSKPATFARELK